MTPVEKWNSFSASADLPLAIVLFLLGLGLIAARGKFAASRKARIERGELSHEEAMKNAKLVTWCSYGVAGGGAFLLVMWALGY